MNKAWHLKNKMPKNATEDERMKWHLEHEKHCDCRPMPAKLKEKLLKKATSQLQIRFTSRLLSATEMKSQKPMNE